MTTPATDRLEALRVVYHAAMERRDAIRETIPGRKPLDLFAPTTPELEVADRDVEQARAAFDVELAAGQADRDAEWVREHTDPRRGPGGGGRV